MNWPVIWPALLRLAGLSDVERNAIVWAETPQQSAFAGSKGQRLEMSIVEVRAHGRDEMRTDDGGPDAEATTYMVGQRTIFWHLTITSQDGTAVAWAPMWLDKVRVRIARRSPENRAILKAANISIRRIGDSRNVSEFDKPAKRLISKWTLEIQIGAVESDRDVSPGAGAWFATATIDSEFLTMSDDTNASPQVHLP